jgi:aldehyde dehydrogenase (NAD+)
VQDWDGFFLGDRWQPAVGTDRVEVVSPASLKVVGSMLRAFADAIEARTDQFADVLCAEQGLPRPGSAGQIAMAVATLRVGADIAATYPWVATRPGTGRRTLRVLRVPVGVVVAIVPWNAPLFVAAMKLAPALAAGNTVVLKPPPETPLHTYLLAEAAIEAGLPDGALNILPAGADVSELLVRDPRVDKVSFTGSTAVGRQVGAICGESLRRCTLELGGKSAAVVLDDSEYGLAGAVWTADLGRGEAVAARIRTGTVAVNSPAALDAYGPFGGFKNSGFGREGGTEALDDYTESQTIILPGQANRREQAA